MKKIVLASAVAIASISVAQAAPTIYGKAFLTAEYNNTDYDVANKKDESSTKLVSQGSRIGFKGGEPLTANTDLAYQLEYQVNIDDNSTQFTSRNTYLGLANKQYGTLLAGRHDTPFKMAKGNVDVFSDYGSLEAKNLMVGDIRADNVIAYKSPKLATFPVTFMIADALSEKDNEPVPVINGKKSEKNPNHSGYSASAVYDENGIYMGLGYDNNVDISDQAWRIAGAVDMGKMGMVNGLTLGAMYQNADIFNSKEDEKSWLLSGKYKVANTPWAVKAQFVNTTDRKGVKDADATEIAVGGEYTFNANTKGHIYAGQINTDKVSDKTVVGAGLEYKF